MGALETVLFLRATMCSHYFTFEGKEYDHLEMAQRCVVLYLRWFKENAPLSQRVSDAWDAGVAAGEAKIAGGVCDRCKEHRLKDL